MKAAKSKREIPDLPFQRFSTMTAGNIAFSLPIIHDIYDVYLSMTEFALIRLATARLTDRALHEGVSFAGGKIFGATFNAPNKYHYLLYLHSF